MQISYIGMQTQEVVIKPHVKVMMKSDAELLDEVVVVAYGTATKKSFTGSATEIKGDRIANKNPSELSKALTGEVAGVQVVSTSGQPGSNASIRIRGLGSVNSSRAPLYVVDGIPFGSDLSGIDPSDIETTTVLKDATATALYGSRAANGVILLTTKKGKKGKTRVEADVKYGVNTRLIPLYDSMESPERFVELTWEGIKNKYQYAGGRDEAAAAAMASKLLWGYDDPQAGYQNSGIYKGYNMWNTGDVIDPATGKFKAGVTRKYTPEKWDDYIFRTGEKFEASVKISGGSEKLSHYTSFGYLKDEGYYIGSDFERFNARSNMSQDITSWLKSNINMAYSYMEMNKPGQGDNMNNGFQFVNFMPSLFPVFQRDENGNKIKDNVVGGYMYDYGMAEGYGRPYASGVNPAGAIQLDKNEYQSHSFNGNAMFEATFLKDFKATVNMGLQYLSTKNNELTNPYYGDAEGLGRIFKNMSSFFSFTSNQILAWKKSYGAHNLDAFIAHESTFYKMSDNYGQKSKIVRPNNTEWSNAVIMDYMDSDSYGFDMESYFGQVRYDYNDRYFLHGTVRRDGSSRFAKGQKWGTFGSIGAAWAITNEDFMKDIKWLKNLKYKLSWGVLGNQDFITDPTIAGYYPYNDLYSIGNLNDEISFSFKYKGNPNLTWERSATWNTGIEFNIADILEGEVEYYKKTTKDMLFLKQVAPSLGYAQYPVNDGKMVNKGIEFSLTAHIIKTNDVNFDIRLNGGHYINKMTQMPIDDTTGKEKPLEIQGGYGWSKGHSLYDFYMREYAGVDPETGMALYNAYYNVKADGTKDLITDMVTYQQKNKIEKLEVEKTSNYNDATKKYVDKSGIPALQGGFGFDLAVKGFELNATFSYSLGGYAYDGVYATLMGDNTSGAGNWHNDIEKRWQKPGDITDVPRLTSGYDEYSNASSTRFITSRSYLNLSNVRLAYTFPKKWMNKMNIGALSIYVSGDNLLFFSARKGFVSMAGNTVSTDPNEDSGSSDRSQYAPLSTIMGGIKIQF
ncbi:MULTISPECIES: SusC/RagA family TonB-linked outer membrane protein [Bacteroides]|uniref:SusC/RagA family TonB-linked outer membrane protein n=1 Tax=Bacteroides TaxID=816 RepID=UPI00241E2D7A|nr:MULTISPECIES: SusC/RagA family TonB-linked outer membrane protein [Bacteroides]